MSEPRPLRILHVLGSLNRGGIETWLMHALRTLERGRFQMDFVVHTDEPGAFDAEVRALGCGVFPCLSPNRPLRYARQLKRVLHDHGPYDVVHSHVHDFSGWVLRTAAKAGVPLRIAHSHNDTRPVDQKAGLVRRWYLSWMRRLIHRHANSLLAASRPAAQALFGPKWNQDPRCRVVYYGIDLEPFQQDAVGDVRAAMGFSTDSVVLGHVGRFELQKNHLYLLQVAAEFMRREPRARLLLVGVGPLRAEVEQHVKALGLSDQVLFAGARADVPALMRHCMDVLVLPSLHEGLPLVCMEAQAAGLPMVITDNISTELDALPPLVRRMPLNSGPVAWASAVAKSIATKGLVPPGAALELMQQSPFNIRESVVTLQTVYESARPPARRSQAVLAGKDA